MVKVIAVVKSYFGTVTQQILQIHTEGLVGGNKEGTLSSEYIFKLPLVLRNHKDRFNYSSKKLLYYYLYDSIAHQGSA